MGRIGTEDSRQALVTALTGKDKDLAAAAAGALGQMGMTDQTKSALLSAARENPAVKMQVMQQLIQNGAPEGMRMAEEMLSAKDETGMASSIIWQVANLGTADAKALLNKAVNSKDTSVKYAAIGALGQNPDDQNTDTLLRLTRDSDATVRQMALQTLGQVGGERAQNAIINATQSGKTEERVAAIQGLASMDDQRASQQVARLMRDSDPEVARAAIYASYNGGAEVDQSLTSIVNDANAKEDLKAAAASQLRSRGTDLDERTEQLVTKLAGAAGGYGGYGYGGYDRYYGRDYIE
jgi:HEAT repeat protein